MLLSKFVYPLSEPDIVAASVYEQPANSVMVYSRGNPYLDSFFIPSRLIPQATTGHTYEFKAHHDSNEGLYPAMLLATNVYVTTNTLYGFQDVSPNMVAFIVTANTVKVGYIDVDSGELVVINSIQLIPRAYITEEAYSASRVTQLKRQLASRTTVAPNNLPKGITSKHWHIADTDGPVLLYTPSDMDVYAHMSLRVFAVVDSILWIGYLGTEPGATVKYTAYTIIKGSQLKLENLVVVAGETVTCMLVSGECDLFAGFLHMRNA